MENFEICIRAIIRNKGKILVCFHKEKIYYFFPGGHLEFGESIPHALFRAVKEELGIKIKKFSLIGLVDNFYEEEGKKHHEINLVFHVIPEKIVSESKENHISFFFFDKKRFLKEKIFPITLQKAILKWKKSKKFFWLSQIYNKTILENAGHETFNLFRDMSWKVKELLPGKVISLAFDKIKNATRFWCF